MKNLDESTNLFNVLDSDEVRNIYSIERIKNNEFESL